MKDPITDLGHGRGWLNVPAAASLHRIDREIGHPLQITDAGRTRAEQQKNYDAWINGTGSFAAYPGTSPHEFGNAIDTNERYPDLMTRHGWWRPLNNEPWHFVYRTWADKHLNDPAPAAVIPLEDDDMLMIRVHASGGRHLCALSVGGFRHFVGSDPYEWIKNVARYDDQWVDVSAADLPALLRTYQCDLHIWDVRGGKFVVLDPLTGSVAPGNMWSAVNVLRSSVEQIKVTSQETAEYIKGIAA